MERTKSRERLRANPGMIIILTGFTSAGKTEIRSRLLEMDPFKNQLVTTTTRGPRDSELNGRDYHFISEEEFSQKIDNGEFVEYSTYYSKDKKTGKTVKRKYGTTKEELERIFSGQNLISTMDIPGAANFDVNVRKAYSQEQADAILKNTLIVYIEADSETILRERFVAREDRKLDEFNSRIVEDRRALKAYGHKFNHRISNLNYRLDFAVSDLEDLIRKTFPNEK